MTSSHSRFLTFLLDQHLCAIPVTAVREINHISQLTTDRSPSLPSVVSLRDTKLPLFDFRQSLGLSQRASDFESRIIILETKRGLTGISVDAVQTVIDLPAIGFADGDETGSVFESIQIRGHTLILINILRAIDPDLSNLAEAFRSVTSALAVIAS